MIRKFVETDLEQVYRVVNEAAIAYKGVIPADRWHEPYMPMDELKSEIASGVEFHLWDEGGEILAVMGIQDRGEVTLIRHAYTRTASQKRGLGTRLLARLVPLATGPILIGTWRDATWAVRFYQNNGFVLTPEAEKNALLARYWSIPERQVETSVVLADSRYRALHPLA
ncbi:MAG: GNAT family N-acetyltransferase [Spirochaetes bacterium]|nr:MAG: GNAT family N-acetyltransferase [Spirochaetota bacterium]